MLDLNAQADALRVENGHRWTVVIAEERLVAWITLSPAGRDDMFALRMDFGDSLAAGPPSVTFCHPETHAEGNRTDWPAGPTKYFKLPPQEGVGWICNPWTREGRAHHSEWRGHPWHAHRALWAVANAMQDILDRPGAFTGRAT